MNFNKSNSPLAVQLLVKDSNSTVTCQMLTASLQCLVTSRGVAYSSMTLFCSRAIIKAKAHSKLPLFSVFRETKDSSVQLNVTN